MIIAALESGEFDQIRYPMRNGGLHHGFSLEGVISECWRRDVGPSAPPWERVGDRFELLGHAFVPPLEVVRWLGLKCHAFDCERHGKSDWQLRNDPHIEHHAKCEGNNFFVDVLEHHATFQEVAAKLRKWE